MDDNGWRLNSHFFPREVFALIFSFVPPKELVHNCKFVCNNWCQMIEDCEVWKIKIRRSGLNSVSKLNSVERARLKNPWFVFYQICCTDPFEKNLLRNNCGENFWEHWDQPRRPQSRRGNMEHLWSVETVPVGADPLPKCEDFGDKKSCFVTSYILAEKKQVVNLAEFGIFGGVLDKTQPKITASEWFAGRFDCGCRYSLKVSLLDKAKNCIEQKTEEREIKQWEGSTWQQVTIEFENYGVGVRYVEFFHSGKDTQFWAGWYGSKMAGGVVKIALPTSSSSIREQPTSERAIVSESAGSVSKKASSEIHLRTLSHRNGKKGMPRAKQPRQPR